MISIKKFLSSDTRERDDAFEHMAYRLLEAIGQNAVEGDRADLDNFQATIGAVRMNLEQNPSPENILIATGAAVAALQSYNRHTSRYIGAKAMELQAIVGMLTKAMSQIAAGSENSVSRLQALQKEIEHAVMIEDVRTLRTRLSDCLQSISGEVTRQRDESSRTISDLKEGMRRGQHANPDDAVEEVEAPAGCDPVTGLPQRRDAEAAIAAGCTDRSHVYAGLFVMDRIRSIQSRFGQTLADQALLFFLQRYVSQALEPTDRVFRWNDASFLALMARSQSPDQVRGNVSRILGRRMEQTLDISGRSVTLAVSSTWLVAPLFENSYPENLKKLDAFCQSLRRT
jgi:GGDEF domain-containing protein